MDPIKPLPGLTPMAPMEPLDFGEPWWPAELGEASAVGAQDGARYAYFDGARRLLVEEDGRLATYDTGEHRIEGVSQAQSHGRTLAFASQHGPVELDALTRL